MLAIINSINNAFIQQDSVLLFGSLLQLYFLLHLSIWCSSAVTFLLTKFIFYAGFKRLLTAASSVGLLVGPAISAVGAVARLCHCQLLHLFPPVVPVFHWNWNVWNTRQIPNCLWWSYFAYKTKTTYSFKYLVAVKAALSAGYANSCNISSSMNQMLFMWAFIIFYLT